jgi:uroporphyrinogen-III synthase
LITNNTDDIHQPLANAGIVITRPAGTSAALAARARAVAGQVVLLPGLALRAPLDIDSATAALRRLRDADIAIFTSPAAVRFAFRWLPTLRVPKRLHVFAIGSGTARALARHAIEAIVPDERSDSEGLLALPALARLRSAHVVQIGAPGGRDLLAPALRRRGAKVETIHVYRRVPPHLTRRHFDALDAAPDPLITLVSSGEALANLVALVPAPQLARMRRQIIVVSSARLVRAARENDFSEIVQARSAAPRDLLAAAEAALSRHRL